MDRLSELEELIRAGWGDMRADRIPEDWRKRKPEFQASEFFGFAAEARREMTDAQIVMQNETLRQYRTRSDGARRGHKRDSSDRFKGWTQKRRAA